MRFPSSATLRPILLFQNEKHKKPLISGLKDVEDIEKSGKNTTPTHVRYMFSRTMIGMEQEQWSTLRKIQGLLKARLLCHDTFALLLIFTQSWCAYFRNSHRITYHP